MGQLDKAFCIAIYATLTYRQERKSFSLWKPASFAKPKFTTKAAREKNV